MEDLFNWQSIAYHEFVPEGGMVSKEWYKELLAYLQEAFGPKSPEMWAARD